MFIEGIRERMSQLRARLVLLRSCSGVGLSPRVSGLLWIHGEGEVWIGDRVFFDAATAPIEILSWAGARVVIGDDVELGGGTSIEATRSIRLGNGVRIGAYCKVMDNHFHPLVGNRRERPVPQPVVLEDGVVLGPCSIVLAGAHLARTSRFGAGSIIKRSAAAPIQPRAS
jgi:acetyltransferase-like isoleucine patch superfamily enzyme